MASAIECRFRTDGRPTRVVGRTPTMFHNTLVVDSSIRKPGKSSKTAKRPAVWVGVRPGELVGLEPCSITLWWLVRVRPAPPPSRLQPEKPCAEMPAIRGTHSLAPAVPTTGEAGLPGFHMPFWNALWMPKSTPKHAVARLSSQAMQL